MRGQEALPVWLACASQLEEALGVPLHFNLNKQEKQEDPKGPSGICSVVPRPPAAQQGHHHASKTTGLLWGPSEFFPQGALHYWRGVEEHCVRSPDSGFQSG